MPAPKATHEARPRRLPIGAEVVGDGHTHFRVWAPTRRRIEVIVEGRAESSLLLEMDGNGYFAGQGNIQPGTLYRFRLDNDPVLYPDPASRFQPHGPHGPSQVVDHRS